MVCVKIKNKLLLCRAGLEKKEKEKASMFEKVMVFL